MDIKRFFTNLATLGWDVFCISSLVGIWPRFIEPRLIRVRRHNLKILKLPSSLEGLKIAHFSDLHFDSSTSPSFLKKLRHKIISTSPDIIVFTGDFICHSQLVEPNRLKEFLSSLSAPLGCFASLGNHDYASYLSVNEEGFYDTSARTSTTIVNALSRFFKTPHIKKVSTDRACSTPLHEGLCQLLKETPFKLLHNQTERIPVKESFLNLCGIGDYMAGRCLPEIAFINYDRKYPGIILSHNPDTYRLLKSYPGEFMLCGHSHGGQVNLPWFRNRLSLLENSDLMTGVFSREGKEFYVTSGTGSPLKFRWFSQPELFLLTLSSK